MSSMVASSFKLPARGPNRSGLSFAPLAGLADSWFQAHCRCRAPSSLQCSAPTWAFTSLFLLLAESLLCLGLCWEVWLNYYKCYPTRNWIRRGFHEGIQLWYPLPPVESSFPIQSVGRTLFGSTPNTCRRGAERLADGLQCHAPPARW